MKRRNWMIGSLALATTLSLGGIGLAQACGGPGMMGGHHRDGGMRFVMYKLDLNDDQEQAIKQLFEEQKDRAQAKRDEMRDIRQALRKQIQSTSYDPNQVRQLAEQQAAIKTELTVQRADTMHRVRQQLTAEQIAKLDEMVERRMERRGHF
jgi:Spy/CpxP family protein refolding chaperone